MVLINKKGELFYEANGNFNFLDDFLAGCTIVWLPYADDENSKGANIVKIEKRK